MSVRRVHLLVGGQLEHRALHLSLGALFPVNGHKQPVTFTTAYVDSFTSTTIDPNQRLTAPSKRPNAPPVETTVLKSARRLVATATEHTDSQLTIVVEDLELANASNAENVVRLFLRAVAHAAGAAPSSRLQARASFHLLCPMVEAYFFGHDAALTAACGSTPASLPPLVSPDVEVFQTTDPAFSGDPRHPKLYARHVAEAAGRNYRETTEGVAALLAMSWPTVLTNCTPSGAAFSRALLLDVADALEVAPPPFSDGATSPATSAGPKTLRNC